MSSFIFDTWACVYSVFSELKRREKQAKKDAEKKEKAEKTANAPSAAKKSNNNAEADEEALNPAVREKSLRFFPTFVF